MHRKLAVMDGRIAFVGGINIVDDWDDLNHRAQTPPRFDYAVKISGLLVAQVHHAVHHLWQIVAWSQVGRRILRRPEPLPTITLPAAAAGSMACAFLVRDNVRHRRDIEDAYLEAIGTARSEILIANAYFLPGRRFLRALIDAARRGVRVTLLLQGKMEYWVQHQATQSLYQRLLAEGIVIHEYRRSFLHAKVAVIDARWATVGSSNIDPFSLLLAREANVLVLDTGFASTLRNSLDAAIASGAERVDDSALQQRSLWQRLQGRIAYLLVRLAAAWSRHGGGAEY
jgi:cardiolipin synthase